MRKYFLSLAVVCLLAILLASCAGDEMMCSADVSTEKEGGISPIQHGDAAGLNLAMYWMAGLQGPKPRLQLNDDVNFDAYDPEAEPPAQKDGLAFGSTLEFVQKGSKQHGVESRLNYFEWQADLQYVHHMAGGTLLFGGLGPYFAYGVGGKTGTGNFESSSFGGTDGYKRFDAGLNLKAGYEMANSLEFQAGYDYGLADKSWDPSDFSSRNRSFSVAVGYSMDKIIGVFKKRSK